MDTYGNGFSNQELRAHYEALIGPAVGLTRVALIAALRGTEFDEHAHACESMAREAAREMQDTLEYAHGILLGTDETFEILVVLVEQALQQGWQAAADEMITLALGENAAKWELLENDFPLSVVSAQMELISHIVKEA